MSEFDIIDMFEAYTVKATFVNGNKMTTDVVAMDDIKKIISELVKKIKKPSVKKYTVAINDIKKILSELDKSSIKK